MIMDGKRFFVSLLLLGTLLGSVGQLLFKIGVGQNALYAAAAYVLAGVILYGIATVTYLYVLSRSHLSWAYGFVGFSYIFTTLLALFVLKEQVSAFRWMGVVVIVVGTALIGLS